MYIAIDLYLFILFILIFLFQVVLSIYFYRKWDRTTKNLGKELEWLKTKVGE